MYHTEQLDIETEPIDLYFKIELTIYFYLYSTYRVRYSQLNVL